MLSIFTAVGWMIGSSSSAIGNAFRKIMLWGIGVFHMIFGKDKKGMPKTDTKKLIVDTEAKPKRIIFIRHGESEWNEVFNRGFGPSFLVRLVKAAIREFFMGVTRDSIFLDSPLSDTGINQAQELIRFLQQHSGAGGSVGSNVDPKADEVVAILNGESEEKSILTTSNLRRAIATGLICLWDRVRHTKERFYVLSCLQEVTTNVDGISLLEKGEGPDSSVSQALGEEIIFDGSFNAGTKGYRCTGYSRMLEFCKWAHARPEDSIVCAGHSLYFQKFFKAFLPLECNHTAKNKKMVNCAVVSFYMYRGTLNGQPGYRIDPDSISVVYGGFSKK